MKKILTLLLAGWLCFSFCGCSKLQESIALKRVEKLIIGQWGHIGTDENPNDTTCYEYIFFTSSVAQKYKGKVSSKNLTRPEYYWLGSYYILGYCNQIVCLFEEYKDPEGYHYIDTIEEIYYYSLEDDVLKIWKSLEQEATPFYYNKGNWSEQVMISILYLAYLPKYGRSPVFTQ